jgi:maltose O-acetyltransferase
MIWKLLRKIRTYWWRLERRVNLVVSYLRARLANGTVQFGRNLVLDVPVRIDGPGQVQGGDFTSLGARLAPRQGSGEILLQARAPEAVISIGQRTWFSSNISIVACVGVSIGNDCLIGDGVTIFDSDFHELAPDRRKVGTGEVAKVTIRDNVWVGSRAMVLKGVTVGSGSVIAPMAVVTKNVPGNCIVAGVPAQVIRHLD